MSKQMASAAEQAPVKKGFLHKIFGSTPGDGELQPKEGIAYSLCGFGQNLICTVIGSYLTVFMTDAIGYNALAVAFLMLFTRVYDAMNDPIMGSIVDRTRTPWGKCRPYLKWMAIPIAIITILCFLPIYPNNPGGFAAISIVYIIWSMVYTVADVPYWGLSTAMSNDTYRRGNLLTIARLLCTAGAGIVTIVVPQITSQLTVDTQSQINVYQALINFFNMNSITLDGINNAEFIIQAEIAKLASASAEGQSLFNGVLAINPDIVSGDQLIAALEAVRGVQAADLRNIYFIVAIVCCAIGIPLFYLGFAQTKERNQAVEGELPSLKHNLSLLFKNKPLMLIVLSGILGSARMVFTYTGGLYFAKYVLWDVELLGMRGEGLYTLITLAVVPGGLIASLLVPYLTKKIGKKQSYIWSHIIGGVALLIAFIVGIAVDQGSYTNPVVLVIAFLALVIAGIPSGLSNIVSYAMIGDTVEYLELKTGERAEGICFAMQTFINKIGMAVGAFIGVLSYYIAGVEANNPLGVTAQSKDIMWTMLMLIAAISFVAAAIPIFFYKFNEKEQLEAAAIIKARKEAKEKENDFEVEKIENLDEVILNEGIANADTYKPQEIVVEKEETEVEKNTETSENLEK